MLRKQDYSLIEQFEKNYNRPGEFLIIQNKPYIAQFLEECLTLLKKNHRFNQYALIKLDNPFLPFLNIQENVLIKVSKKDKSLSLEPWLNLFEIPAQLLHKYPDSLSSIDCLKFQLIHELLLEKQMIFLPDISTIYNTHELQDLLRILKNAAKKTKATILLTTNDEKILSSSYHPHKKSC